MQPEVSTPRRRGAGRVREEHAAGETAGYVYSTAGTIGHYFRQPLVIGALLMAIIGSVIGIRTARMRAVSRQRSFSQRAFEVISYIGPIALLVSRIRWRRMMMRRMMQGRGIAGVTGGWTGGLAGNLPPMGFMSGPARRGRDMGQQIGSALSLIPPALAILRNPFVRNMGFRMLSRRMFLGVNRGFGRGFLGR